MDSWSSLHNIYTLDLLKANHALRSMSVLRGDIADS